MEYTLGEHCQQRPHKFQRTSQLLREGALQGRLKVKKTNSGQLLRLAHREAGIQYNDMRRYSTFWELQVIEDS
jgi:hypothetical protein